MSVARRRKRGAKTKSGKSSSVKSCNPNSLKYWNPIFVSVPKGSPWPWIYSRVYIYVCMRVYLVLDIRYRYLILPYN